MQTVIVQAHNDEKNWGKFLVGRCDSEWSVPAAFGPAIPLLPSIGWGRRDILVLDLQTCEGAVFSPHGLARADLNKHCVWVCPLFEPFLTWLYRQDLADLTKLPAVVNLPDAEFSLAGHRRPGPTPDAEAQALALRCARLTLADLPDLPVRVDEMNLREQAMFEMIATLTGSMTFIERTLAKGESDAKERRAATA